MRHSVLLGRWFSAATTEPPGRRGRLYSVRLSYARQQLRVCCTKQGIANQPQ